MDSKHQIDFRFAPPSAWTSICLPDDPYKTLVRDDGALLYGYKSDGFQSWWFERVLEFGILAAHAAEAVHQSTESARFPCTVTTLRYARATLELRAFAHQHEGGRRTDIVLWTIRAHPAVKEFLTGLKLDVYELNRLFMGRSYAPARVIFAVELDKVPPYDFMVDGNQLNIENESKPGPGEVAFISSPYQLVKTNPAGFRPCSGLSTEAVILKGGEMLHGAIILPLNYKEEAHYDLAWAEAAYQAERSFWENLPLFRLPFQIPDPAVMEMLISCARNILQAREIKDGLPVFQVGPAVYRGLWVLDGHFLLEVARYLGFQEDANAAVDTLLQRAHPDGSITIFPFHTKETGISIATLVRQCELAGDDARLRSIWPVILKAVGYIEGMRREAYALPPTAPNYRLLPDSFADGGLGGKRPEYTTPFWILSGLNIIAQAAERLGLPDAARIREDFESLLKDFREHAARDMRTLPDGVPYLPMCKPGSGEHVWIPNYPGEVPQRIRLTPASATWAMSHAITPGEIFAPQDPLVQNLLHLYDLVDDDEGMPAFTGWLPYQALWSYHASFAAHTWLYAGRGDKAVDYLYAFANHAFPTRVWREEQSMTASENGQIVGDMPHNWASAEFIRLTRHLLVFERGMALELLAGLPAEWTRPGSVVYLEKTPTRFGPVTLRLETDQQSRCIIDLTLDPAWSIKPEAIRVHLAMASNLQLNGKPVAADANGLLQLPVSAKNHLSGAWHRA